MNTKFFIFLLIYISSIYATKEKMAISFLINQDHRMAIGSLLNKPEVIYDKNVYPAVNKRKTKLANKIYRHLSTKTTKMNWQKSRQNNNFMNNNNNKTKPTRLLRLLNEVMSNQSNNQLSFFLSFFSCYFTIELPIFKIKKEFL